MEEATMVAPPGDIEDAFQKNQLVWRLKAL